MAWKDTLQDASFRGVAFSVANVGRAGMRAIALHEYPYTAGADLEDMNIGPRQVRLQAVFFGDDYEERLARFVDALEAPGSGDLVHPVHGPMTVMAQGWEDVHDADFEGASVQATFVEDSTRQVLFSDASASAQVDAVGDAAEDARDAATDGLASWMDSVPTLDLPRITVLKEVFSQAKAVVAKFLAASNGVAALLSDLDPILYPRAYAADLLAMVDRAFQGLPFGGRNLLYGTGSGSIDTGSTSSVANGSGKTDFDTVRRLLEPSDIVLDTTEAITDASTDMLADAAVVQAYAQAFASTVIAEAAAVVLGGELEAVVLERAEVETICAQARAAVQTAIDGARGALGPEHRALVCQALRDLAAAVLQAGQAVINLRPPLGEHAAPVAGPARLVAHALYGDGSRAAELVRLNGLGRWLYVEQGEVLHAYAE